MRFLYICFTWAYAAPLAAIVLVRGVLFRSNDAERLGFGLPKPAQGEEALYWLVASSVGEVVIALKLTARLKARSGARVLLTVTTPTGRKHAENAAERPDFVCYHPFDIAFSASRFLAHFTPRAIVLIETELWPTLMVGAHQQGVPVVQVSGRISDKSFGRYQGLKSVFAPLLKRCRGLWMQSPLDAERIIALGAPAEIVETIGSIKEDYVAPDAKLLAEIDQKLRAWSGKRLIVGGSTRPGEEAILVEAFEVLRKQFSDLRLVIVPRHLERLDEVLNVIPVSRVPMKSWSAGAPAASDEILVVDAIGLLNAIYHRAAVAVVGGTFAEIGGHNLLEPALAGCPVFYGPHYFQQHRGHELLQEHEMGFVVGGSAELADRIAELLGNSELRSQYAQRAQELRTRSSHVLDEYVERIVSISEY